MSYLSRWGESHLLGVREVRQILESEWADDGEDGEEATAEEDDPGVLAEQDEKFKDENLGDEKSEDEKLGDEKSGDEKRRMKN